MVLRWLALLLPVALSGACPSLNSTLLQMCACDPNAFNGLILDCPAAEPNAVFQALRRYREDLGLIQLLRIRNTTLNTLPDDLFKGLYIKKLDLSDNEITSIAPKAFAGLENILQSLSMKGNALSSFPSAAVDGMSALIQLDISHNNIGDITMKESLENMPKLSDLNLANNAICDIYKGAFDSVKHSVQTLNLGYNCLSKVPAPAIRGFRQLIALHLNNNAIGFLDPLHFMNLPGLNLLNLAGNAITGLHRMAFINVANLRMLYLADNNLTDIAPGQFAHFEALEMLDLTRNRIRRVPEAAFANMTRLSQLYLGENGIEEIGANAFANASLTMLLLPYNRLTHLGSDAFLWMHHLQQLSLKNNSISSIAQNAFYHMPSLVMVDLSHNQLRQVLPGTFLPQLHLFLVDLSNNAIAHTPANSFNRNTATIVLKENPVVCTERVHLIQKGQPVFVPGTPDLICGGQRRPLAPALPAVPNPNPRQPLPNPSNPVGAGGARNPFNPANSFVQGTDNLPQNRHPIIRPVSNGQELPTVSRYRPVAPAVPGNHQIGPAPHLPAPSANLPTGPRMIGPSAHFNGFASPPTPSLELGPSGAASGPLPPSPETWGKENLHLIPPQEDVFGGETTTPAPYERRTILPFPVPFLKGRVHEPAFAVTVLPTTTEEATLPPGIVTASRNGPNTGLPTWTEPKPKIKGPDTAPVTSGPRRAGGRTTQLPPAVRTVAPKKRPDDIFGNQPAIGNFDPDSGRKGASGTGSATTTIAVCLTVVVMVMVAVFITLCVVRHRSSHKRSESSASRTSAYVAAQAARVNYAASNYGTASLARMQARPPGRGGGQAWIYAPGSYSTAGYYG